MDHQYIENDARNIYLNCKQMRAENIKCGFWDKPCTFGGASNKFCDSCAPPSFPQLRASSLPHDR